MPVTTTRRRSAFNANDDDECVEVGTKALAVLLRKKIATWNFIFLNADIY